MHKELSPVILPVEKLFLSLVQFLAQSENTEERLMETLYCEVQDKPSPSVWSIGKQAG